MRQVLWNLVRNGVQASGAGATVIVSVSETTTRVVMAVSDEGPGIDAASRAKIFDAFFTTRSQGAGLGLAVVRRIIDDHTSVGASIDVRSGRDRSGRSSRGATFEVGLARTPPPGTRTGESATIRPGAASDHRATGGENARSHPTEN
jgi:signal transduction histidine kinase